MDIWFIDAENVGCGLLDKLPVKGITQQRIFVFSKSSNAAKWVARYPLHAALFSDYEVGKNQADFYMISVLTQALITEPLSPKQIILITKDQDLIQAFKQLCNRHQTKLTLLVSEESNQLPSPEVANESGVPAEHLPAQSREILPVASSSDGSQKQSATTKHAPKPAKTTVQNKPPKKGATQSKKLDAQQLMKKQKKVLKHLSKVPLSIQEMRDLLKLNFAQIQEVTNPLIKGKKIERVSKTGKKWRAIG